MTRNQTYATIGTVVVCILVLLLLLFVYIHGQKSPEEEKFPYDEGIMMDFTEQVENPYEQEEPEDLVQEEAAASQGNNATGGGEQSNKVEGTPDKIAPKPIVNPVKPQPTPKQALTQEQESPVKTQKVENKESEADIEARKAAEAAKKAAEEKAAKEAAATQKANKLGNLLGSGKGQTGIGSGTGSGSGSGVGSGQQGNPAGHGTSGGNGWSLRGRSLIGSLAKPYQAPNTEGIIVVNIRVDKAGKVISASIAAGSTISDAQMRQSCIEKAKLAKFTASTDGTEATGQITYRFAIN